MSRLLIALAVVLLFAENVWAQIQWKTLDYPGAAQTFLGGISGNNIVGGDWDKDFNKSSFLYNGSAFLTLNDPLAPAYQTFAAGIDGNNIVGGYYDAAGNEHGFLYNGSTWTNLDDPLGTIQTNPLSISGNDVTGFYENSTGIHGFIYNGSSYTTIDDPLAKGETIPSTISGSDVVGYYWDGTNMHGFLYNGWSFTTLDDPLAAPGANGGTWPMGVWGNDIVGYYGDSKGQSEGFLYNGSTYTTLNYPNSTSSFFRAIQGNTLIGGYYAAGSSDQNGFIAIVPEPSTFGLLGIGAVFLAAYGWRRRKIPSGKAAYRHACRIAVGWTFEGQLSKTDLGG